MSVLVISNYIKLKEEPDLVQMKWVGKQLPQNLKTFKIILIDFSGIIDYGFRVKDLHLKLCKELPKLLKGNKILVIFICGVKNEFLYHYPYSDLQPSIQEIKEYEEGYHDETYKGRIIKPYLILKFLKSQVQIQDFHSNCETIRLIKSEQCPCELEKYLNPDWIKRAEVYFDFKKTNPEIFANGLKPNDDREYPVSFRIRYGKGELIFLPGYDSENPKWKVHPDELWGAVKDMFKLKNIPEWFIDFSLKYLPCSYYESKKNVRQYQFISEMLFDYGDYPIDKKESKNKKVSKLNDHDHLVGKIRAALFDIFADTGAEISESSSEADRRGIDLKIKYESIEIIIQIKGLLGRADYNDIKAIKIEKNRRGENVFAIFIANTHRLKPFEDRLKFTPQDNFDETIIGKDFHLISMTTIDLYQTWRACIDEIVERKQIIKYILEWPTSKIFEIPYESKINLK